MGSNIDKTTQEGARERLDVPTQTSIERKLLVGNQRPTVKPPISQPVGKSALLGRLQSFLPQMEQANKEIDAAGNAPEVGFEEPPEGDGAVVELDLACGLFELKDDAAVSAAEGALINQGVALEEFSGGSSSSSDDSDSENDSSTSDSEDNMSTGSGGSAKDNQPSSAEPKSGRKKLRRKKHPGIEELT